MSDKPAGPADTTALTTELQARKAEIEWLKTHYEEQLRAAFAQIASLQARLRTRDGAPPAAMAAESRQEIDSLRAELVRLTAAERRYLDRIEELKEVAGDAR